jgi:hypothetical protein
MLNMLYCSRCFALADRHRPPVGHLLLMDAMILAEMALKQCHCDRPSPGVGAGVDSALCRCPCDLSLLVTAQLCQRRVHRHTCLRIDQGGGVTVLEGTDVGPGQRLLRQEAGPWLGVAVLDLRARQPGSRGQPEQSSLSFWREMFWVCPVCGVFKVLGHQALGGQCMVLMVIALADVVVAGGLATDGRAPALAASSHKLPTMPGHNCGWTSCSNTGGAKEP